MTVNSDFQLEIAACYRLLQSNEDEPRSDDRRSSDAVKKPAKDPELFALPVGEYIAGRQLY